MHLDGSRVPQVAAVSDNEMVTWLRRRVEQRLYLARHAVELGNAEVWTELSSGVLMTVAPDAPQDGWDGIWAMGDSSLTRLMEANDPRDTIARCEAELAVLDLFAETAALAGSPPLIPLDDPRVPEADRQRIAASHPGPVPGVVSARDCLDARRELAVLRPVVRQIGFAHRHKDGYREEWRP